MGGPSLPGDVVVQNGATSMVGQCVIQLAQLSNVQTVNLVRDRYVQHTEAYGNLLCESC